MKSVVVLNGPNLGRLGSREPDIYGSLDYLKLEEFVAKVGAELDLAVKSLQSDSESELISAIHEATSQKASVVINPAAFTHYSYALADACKAHTAAGLTLIEVHISNPHGREEFRQKSVISPTATGMIAGLGFDSYRLALIYLSKVTH